MKTINQLNIEAKDLTQSILSAVAPVRLADLIEDIMKLSSIVAFTNISDEDQNLMIDICSKWGDTTPDEYVTGVVSDLDATGRISGLQWLNTVAEFYTESIEVFSRYPELEPLLEGLDLVRQPVEKARQSLSIN